MGFHGILGKNFHFCLKFPIFAAFYRNVGDGYRRGVVVVIGLEPFLQPY